MTDWTEIKGVNNTGADDGRIFAKKNEESGGYNIVYQNGAAGIEGVEIEAGYVPIPNDGSECAALKDVEFEELDDIAILCKVKRTQKVVILDSIGMVTIDGDLEDVILSNCEVDPFCEEYGWEGAGSLYCLGGFSEE